MRVRRSCLGIAGLFLLLSSTAFASGDGGGHGGGMTHKMMMVAVQLGIILFAAKIGSMIFAKLKMPGVLGELCGGILIGPFALGQVPLPGFVHGLFPIMSEAAPIAPELYSFAAVAAIILLFDVGLETDLKLLIRYMFAGALTGLGGVIASFVLGAWVTSAMSSSILGTPLPFFSPVCLFMGVISTATSVGITARVLSEKKKLDSPEGVTILSAAVIDDVIGIIILAIIMGIVSSTSGGTGEVDWGKIGKIGAKAVGVWLVSTVIGIVASRKISFLLKLFKDKTSIAIMAFGLALILAGLFEQVGLAMIIGAYVMGLSLSQADISHLVREKIHPIYAFMVPVFFCVTGMMINLKALTQPGVVLFGFVYTVVAILAKVLGSGLPAMFANFNLLGSLRIGCGMVPRGEVGLIIASIGLNAKLMPDGSALPSSLFASVIMMIMINTILAPLTLTKLFSIEKRGTRKEPVRDEDEESIEFNLASEHMAEFFIRKLRDEFEGEGFFCHLLNHSKQLHQLRKDDSIIDFQCEGPTLTFTCNAADAVLVRGAMLEATASIEDALRSLREPLDSRSMGQGMLDQQEGPARKFNLAQFMTPDHVNTNLSGNSKEAIIDELLQVLVDQGSITDFAAAKAAIWEREKKMTTGLEAGVAIPHGKTDTVDKLVCAIGICYDGVDFESLDGEPSRIFVITLSPKSKPAPHIQFMSTISQLLNETGRMYLLDDHTQREIYDYMTGAVTAPPRRRGVGTQLKVSESFDFSTSLKAATMVCGLQADSTEAIIHEMLGALETAGSITGSERVAAKVLERERMMSTVMEEGIAIPHARTDLVDRLTCAIGIAQNGVDFDGDGAVETKIIVLIVCPESSDRPYLQFVASLVKTLDPDKRERILRAASSEQMLDVLVS